MLHAILKATRKWFNRGLQMNQLTIVMYGQKDESLIEVFRSVRKNLMIRDRRYEKKLTELQTNFQNLLKGIVVVHHRLLNNQKKGKEMSVSVSTKAKKKSKSVIRRETKQLQRRYLIRLEISPSALKIPPNLNTQAFFFHLG